MRTIVTAITAAALALSLTFQAAPANAAVPGYDSSYAGESAFLNLDQGDSGSFTVFFANTGTTTWTTGSATQVDLAACLEDKVTCNQQDADEADFNDGWLSATRYATHTQTSVAPGQIGTFTYDVMVPADAAEDTFRFNGALVLASSGADIHNEGYFQDVTTGTPATEGAATIDELDPDEGGLAGGTTVVIAGEDIDCTPTFPTVLFGDNEADVISCGATSLTVESPAGDAVGDVDVTVTNSGASASNALTFTYEDVTRPTFDSIDVQGQVVTLNFSEAVCADVTFDEDVEYQVTINGADSGGTEAWDSAECADDEFEQTATITLTGGTTLVAGDEVRVTITGTGADEIEDEAGNTMDVAQSRTATAVADVTEPDIASAAVVSANTIRLTFTEPVYCTGTPADDFDFEDADDDTTEATGITGCGTTPGTADTSFDLTFPSGTVGQGDSGTVIYDEDTAEAIQDISGNDLGDQTIAVTALEEDDPTIEDAALTTTAGLAGTMDSGDRITLTFSEDMGALAVGDQFRVQDEDGSVTDIVCDATTLGAADPTDDVDLMNAVCELDDDEITIEIRDDGVVADEAADGDVPGLQYPATIIDTSGVTDEEGNSVDLANSADVVIEDE